MALHVSATLASASASGSTVPRTRMAPNTPWSRSLLSRNQS